MRPTPDVAGFASAQVALRAALGVDAVFLIPGEATWPAGTPLDPETGKPYDPFLEPESATATQEITVRCSFVHSPLTSADPEATPIGAADRGSAALVVPLADYPTVRAATRVRVGAETWDIQQFRYDLALTVPRWIAYLEHA
jgi:hypothetical protein